MVPVVLDYQEAVNLLMAATILELALGDMSLFEDIFVMDGRMRMNLNLLR